MSLLNLSPTEYRKYVDMLLSAAPVLRCSVEGHTPELVGEGKPFEAFVSGRGPWRMCKRCRLVYWAS